MKSFSGYLRESSQRGVVVTWGRYNPPTTGHETVFNTAAKNANQRRMDLRIFATHTHDAKKNPLPYKMKMDFLRRIFPRYKNYILNSEAKTIIQALVELNKVYSSVVLVVGGDRVKEFQGMMDRVNGKDFTYESIEVVSAGHRDPDAEGIEGMSASKMRALAASGNFREFMQGLPASTTESLGRELYNAIRDGLGLENSSPAVELVRTETRERFYSGDLLSEGDLVVTKDGTRGKVSYLGANYVIVESNKNKKRHWVQDVTKVTDLEGAIKRVTDAR